jgi:hypothetical protein
MSTVRTQKEQPGEGGGTMSTGDNFFLVPMVLFLVLYK